jgi:hypothetical protein
MNKKELWEKVSPLMRKQWEVFVKDAIKDEEKSKLWDVHSRLLKDIALDTINIKNNKRELPSREELLYSIAKSLRMISEELHEINERHRDKDRGTDSSR